MTNLQVRTPNNLEELKECLKKVDEKTYIIAGGTDFVIKMRKKSIYQGTVIDLTGIKELKYIKKEDGFIKIGANSTFTEIEENPLVKEYAQCVKEAAERVGSKQIRNTATMAGNIANASPAADSIPALMTLEAKVKTINGSGEIGIKEMDEVVEGLNKNKLQKDEAIIEILIPIKDKSYRSTFSKVGSRSTVTISKLSTAVLLKYTDIIEEVRIFIGALGPKAFESKIAEEILIDKKPSKELLEEFEKALEKQVDLAIPGRYSQAYKRECIKGIGYDIFNNLFKA